MKEQFAKIKPEILIYPDNYLKIQVFLKDSAEFNKITRIFREENMRVPAGKTADSRAFDKRSMDAGIPSLILMENAAFSLFIEVKRVIDEWKPERIVVFSGNGGNGGDGFALLRILADRVPGMPLFLVEAAEFKEQNKIPENSAWANRMMLPQKVQIIDSKDVSGKVLFVDAMLGTGLKSEISGKIKESVEFINSYPADHKFVVSVDVPTGLDCDTGAVLGDAVKAALTVTMGIYKTGLFAGKGTEKSGEIVLGHISAVSEKAEAFKYFVEENPVVRNREIPLDSFKNRNGHLLVIGGDVEKVGATIISAKSFMSCGGGLVSSAFKKEFLPSIAGKMPGLMLVDVAELKNELHRFQAIVIGPGLSEIPFDFEILKDFEGVIVVDAGMFDIMPENRKVVEILKDKKVVFTPHQGEIRRFLKADKNEPWINLVERFPLEKNHVLIAKSHATFVRNPEKTVIIPAGARALAFGGSGDALTGIAAFETLQIELFEGCVNAVVRHRAAGLELEKRFSAVTHDIEKLVEMIVLTER